MSAMTREHRGRKGGPRRTRPWMRRAAAVAIVLALCAWASWGVVQTRLTIAQSPAARSAAAGCSDVEGTTWIYRITLVGRGALCSALMRQEAFYAYATSRVVPAHWSRLDCAVTAPHAAPFCSEHMLGSLGDWINLAGPPAREVTALTAASVP